MSDMNSLCFSSFVITIFVLLLLLINCSELNCFLSLNNNIQQTSTSVNQNVIGHCKSCFWNAGIVYERTFGCGSQQLFGDKQSAGTKECLYKRQSNCKYLNSLRSSAYVVYGMEILTAKPAKTCIIFGATSQQSYISESLPETITHCLVTGYDCNNTFWSKVDFPFDFGITSKTVIDQPAYFKMSRPLMDLLCSQPGPIYVQFMLSEYNYIGWNERRSNPIKNIISLTIKKAGRKPFKTLSTPIDLYFKYSTEDEKIRSTGVVKIPSQNNMLTDLEELVSVYRLDKLHLVGSGNLVVRFHDVGSLKFKVLFSVGEWPDYELMSSKAIQISHTSPVYEVSLENITADHTTYLGIISTEKNTSKKSVPFSFDVKYFQCHTKIGKQWTNLGCRVGPESREGLLHCQCWHLSLFGGGVAISPREVDIASDIKLLNQVKDSPDTLIAVSTLIMLYLMVLVWTRHNDSKDRLQRLVIVLDDNFPGEGWPYLITVFTGLWIGAGTAANVCIRLYGTKGISRIHKLQSNQRRVLKENCDDWFMIFNPFSLGDIEKIHIFHDSSGGQTDWYCTKIMVYDLHAQNDFRFDVDKWISLAEEDENIEWFLTPTIIQKSLTRDRIALDNVLFGLKETHLLISIFTRHPRSSVTRSQRLSILICLIMVTLLSTIIFHGLEEPEYPVYSEFKMKLIITLEGSLLASPFSFLIIFCFKKSRIVAAPQRDVPMNLTGTQPVTLESGLPGYQSRTTGLVLEEREADEDSLPSLTHSSGESTDSSSSTSSSSFEEVEEEQEKEPEEGCFKNCFKQIKSILFQAVTNKAMMPVRIVEEDKEFAYIRKQWMYFAWILCETAIFLSAFLIVLYSIKMDQKRRKEWLENSLRNVANNVLFLAPLKIMAFAVILAILYGQLQYVGSYECNIEAAIKRKYVGNERFLTKVLKIRQQKCYKPLTYRKKLVIKLKKRTWRRWRIIINFLVIILLYLVLSAEVMVYQNGLYLETQQEIENILKGNQTRYHGFQQFQIHIMSLVDRVMPMYLNRLTWYNNDSLMNDQIWNQEMGFLRNGLSRLVSHPRIRQQRVKEDSCKVQRQMQWQFFQCNAPYSLFSMDTKSYAPKWTNLASQRLTGGTGSVEDYWSSNKSESSIFVCGPDTKICYINKGYIVTLPFDNAEASEYFRNIVFLNEWLDGLTRVVFFEFISYNPNANLISNVIAMTEKLADGSFYLSTQVISLHPISGSFIASLVMLLFFSFYYLLRIILLFNRHGLFYLMSAIGMMDVFLNTLLCITITSLCLYKKSREEYLYNWQQRGQHDLLITTDMMLHKELLNLETSILVIICPAQVLHSCRLGKKFLVCMKTLLECFYFSICIFFIMIFFFLGFQLLSTLNNMKTIICPFNRFFSFLSYAPFPHSSSYSYADLFLHPLSLVFGVFTNLGAMLVTVTVSKSFQMTKIRYRFARDFNIIMFVWERLKYIRKRVLKIRRKVTTLAGKRLRAGAEELENDLPYEINRKLLDTQQLCNDISFKFDLLIEKLKKM